MNSEAWTEEELAQGGGSRTGILVEGAENWR
jgi:hypothetical protein